MSEIATADSGDTAWMLVATGFVLLYVTHASFGAHSTSHAIGAKASLN